MAGELERIDETIARLTARRAHLVAVQGALGGVAELMEAPQLPSVIPSVRAHTTFGARGRLRNYLRECLRVAAPAPMDTRTLAALVIDHFGLSFPNAKERQRFLHTSVGRTLNKLLARDEVERLSDHTVARNLPSIWRWKTGPDSLEALSRSTEVSLGEA